MNKNNFKKAVNHRLSDNQKLFTNAIDFNALHKALNDPKSKKEIMTILNKVRF